MAQTFFFYDLETSGLDPRVDRVMQFAGQRTDMDLNPIDEPRNMLVRLSDDTLPSVEAIMVTGITPQQTQSDGYSEAEFARILNEEICTDDTIIVGFNTIRFDDEFIRALLWRNFYDPYEWCWLNGRSRWDLLDVVRMTRALRPDGIVWPEVDGQPTNRLELLTAVNGITHQQAHDALSDVEATIAVARLIKTTQPQLYQYLLDMRDKNKLRQLVNLENKAPFVYTSGRYDAEHHKTTVAFPLTTGKNSNVVVYDLRYSPEPFIKQSADELAKTLSASWQERHQEGYVPVPVKELQYNRCPAVAPLGVLEQGDGWQRLQLDKAAIERHKNQLLAAPHFAENIRTAIENKPPYPKAMDPEALLYDGFIGNDDKLRAEAVRHAGARELADFQPEFNDERLPPLFLHYKARNFPHSLSQKEAIAWERWRAAKIMKRLPGYSKALQTAAAAEPDEARQFLLSELHLWAESIMPSDMSGDEAPQA